MEKCTAIIHRILERESRGWYIKFKDKIIADVKGNGISYNNLFQDFIRIPNVLEFEYII